MTIQSPHAAKGAGKRDASQNPETWRIHALVEFVCKVAAGEGKRAQEARKLLEEIDQ